MSVFNALFFQFQVLLTDDSERDDNWPNELSELRNKFTSNTKKEIEILKEQHIQELKRLKDEKNKKISELQNEIQTLKSITQESFESNLVEER